MTVPRVLAVASIVPVELRESKERGCLWAWMTLATVRERVLKRRTSPDCGAGALPPLEEGTGAEGEGTGEG
jgi:hypothetical protein